MPSRNPSRNSGSEETIMWKLPDLREIKKQCLFGVGFFFFQSNQDLFFSLCRPLMRGPRKRLTLVATQIHSPECSQLGSLSPFYQLAVSN